MKTLLLIEDDKMLLNMYQKLFANHNYNIIAAEDGKNGLKKALEEHPDLILLDLKLPKMDGMTVLKNLRSDGWGRDAKVIILTNIDPNDITLKGVVEDYPTYYLLKATTRFEEVLEKVREVLSEQKDDIDN